MAKYIFLRIECPPGKFGLDCSQVCSGHCIHNEPCDHVSGACFNGCGDGFVGTSCNKRNFFYSHFDHRICLLFVYLVC